MMAGRLDDLEVRGRVADLEARLGELEALEEPARGTALGAVRALAELYGEALARIVGRLVTASPETDASAIAEALSADELVSHLLALHDLNPAAAEALRLGTAFVPRAALTKR
ncbi:MAG: hypothetical protein ACODAE_10845 [Gemmatimonadota bacterium]